MTRTVSDRIPVPWGERPEPLESLAVVAFDGAARSLARRVLEASDDRLSRLRAAGGTAACALLILGVADDLPWADGAVYLGKDPEAPSLLLPTMLRPDMPLPLVERAVLRQSAGMQGPIVYLPPSLGNRLLSANPARSVVYDGRPVTIRR